VCTTDHSGLNNIFIENPLPSLLAYPPGKLKLILGLGLGLGFSLVVGVIVTYGLRTLKKGKRKEVMARVDRLKNNARITDQETS